MSQADFAYVFKVATGTVSVPAGLIEMKVTWALDARRRRRKPLSLDSMRAVFTQSGELKCGSTELRYFYSLKSRSSRKPTRGEMIFGRAQMGEIVERRTQDVLAAVNSMLEDIEAGGDALATEYGLPFVLTERVVDISGLRVDRGEPGSCAKSDPVWSAFIAGLRFADDPHAYTAWAGCGMLDLIKHDPATGKETDRADIRSREVLQTVNAGEIPVFRRPLDLQPLRTGLAKLRELLQTTPDETVASMSVPRGSPPEQMQKTWGANWEAWGFWEEPDQ